MTTQQRVDREVSLAVEQLDADVREAEGKLKVMEAQARSRNAKAEMDDISGLTAAKEKVKRQIADLKRGATADAATTKQGVQKSIAELKASIQRAGDRYSAWDAARERQFNAQLDEAEAKIQVWTAKADQSRAEMRARSHGELSALKEKIALGRERAKAARAKHDAQSQAELQQAATQFDTAYGAAIVYFDGV